MQLIKSNLQTVHDTFFSCIKFVTKQQQQKKYEKLWK